MKLNIPTTPIVRYIGSKKTAIENEKCYRKVENTNRTFHFPLYICHYVQNGKTVTFSLFLKFSKKY